MYDDSTNSPDIFSHFIDWTYYAQFWSDYNNAHELLPSTDIKFVFCLYKGF